MLTLWIERGARGGSATSMEAEAVFWDEIHFLECFESSELNIPLTWCLDPQTWGKIVARITIFPAGVVPHQFTHQSMKLKNIMKKTYSITFS